MLSPLSKNIPSIRQKRTTTTEKAPAKNSPNQLGKGSSKLGAKAGSSSTKKHATVRAEPLEVSAFSVQSYTPPIYPKSDVEEMFLYEALRKSFMFSSLSQQEMFTTIYPLIDSMEKVHFNKGDTIIQQGATNCNYCYVIFEGSCSVIIDGNVLGSDSSLGRGDCFGELALLYSSPRAATVKTCDDVEIFRLDQMSFRHACQFHVESHLEKKRHRLENVPFLAELSDSDKRKAISAMTLRNFKQGDRLMSKGEEANLFWILDEGKLKIHDLETTESGHLSDIVLDPGDYFGQTALVSGRPLAGNVTAITDGSAFLIDKDHFVDAVGNLDQARERGLTRKLLEAVRIVKNSMFASETLDALVKLIRDESFAEGDVIMEKGQDTEAALYFLRDGSLRLVSTQKKEVLLHDVGIFGEDMLLLDARRGRNGPDLPTRMKASCTVTATTNIAVSILKLQDCRRVINTLELGRAPHLDSIIHTNLKVNMSNLTKQSMLGEGQFGQVWLVTRTTSAGKERVYALKVQSKADLLRRHQAEGAARERDIMAQFYSPFVTKLIASFQDARCVYMLMDFLQGGELDSIIHSESKSYLSDDEASFYAAGIVEGLAYMHRLGIVYRDLKPQNVLLNDQGYPVLADFGFAKTLAPSGLTFTFCGTPEYLAPEIIVNRGHGLAVDYYTCGVLVWEMLSGCTPFDKDDQSELFRAIVQDQVEFPDSISPQARSLLSGLLEKNPQKRLGARAKGAEEIVEHSWFNSIDFSRLARIEIKAPFVPTCRDIRDASYFALSPPTSNIATDDPIDATENTIFEKF